VNAIERMIWAAAFAHAHRTDYEFRRRHAKDFDALRRVHPDWKNP